MPAVLGEHLIKDGALFDLLNDLCDECLGLCPLLWCAVVVFQSGTETQLVGVLAHLRDQLHSIDALLHKVQTQKVDAQVTLEKALFQGTWLVGQDPNHETRKDRTYKRVQTVTSEVSQKRFTCSEKFALDCLVKGGIVSVHKEFVKQRRAL